MGTEVAVYRQAKQIYHADTCEPLKQAAEQGEVTLVARGRGAYPGASLPARVLTEVRSLGYWNAEHNQTWGLDWHRNEGIELTYVARGRVRFSIDKHELLLKRGDLAITRPWQAHRIGDPHITASRLHWLILDVGVRRPNQAWCWPSWLAASRGDIKSLTTMLSHNEQPVWEVPNEIEHYFEQLGEVVATYNESRIKLYISGLLIALTELLEHHQPTLDTSLSSAHRTVELFLASLPTTVDQPWDLTSMAAACGLGRSRFTYYCKEITNMSPMECLTCCRVEAAAHRLIDQPKRSITDVALGCGFESAQYFSRVFHESKGCSPRAFRRLTLL
jgi:AraC-like DNA-binding protein